MAADCRLNEGNIDCDESSLTGESLPSHKYKGSKVFMGTAVQRGESYGTVEFIGPKTSMATTAQAKWEGEEEQPPGANRHHDRAGVPVHDPLYHHLHLPGAEPGCGGDLSFVVVLLVASIPLAVEIVTTTTLALGSKEPEEWCYREGLRGHRGDGRHGLFCARTRQAP